MWGSTILDTQEADLDEELDKAFSTKPCHGMIQIAATKQKEEEDNSKNCLMWSEEQYEHADFLRPTFCQLCDSKSPSDIKVEDSLESEIEAQQSMIEIRNEGIESDFEVPIDADFTSDDYIIEEDYEAVRSEDPKIRDKFLSEGFSQDHFSPAFKSMKLHKVKRCKQTGTTSYNCNFCPYTTVHSGNIKKHTRTHTGEKPFSCKTCPWKFGNKSTLNRHQRKCKKLDGISTQTTSNTSYENYSTELTEEVENLPSNPEDNCVGTLI